MSNQNNQRAGGLKKFLETLTRGFKRILCLSPSSDPGALTESLETSPSTLEAQTVAGGGEANIVASGTGIMTPSEPIAAPVPEGDRPRPTVEEAKAEAEAHAHRYEIVQSAFGVVTNLLRVIQPCLEGTPVNTPVDVLLAIADVIEAVQGNNDKAKNVLANVSRRLAIVEEALQKNDHSDSGKTIINFAKLLVEKAVQLHEIRGKSTWKKVLESKDGMAQIQAVVDEVNECTNNIALEISFGNERNTTRILESLTLDKLFHVPTARYYTSPDEGIPKRQACTKGTRTGILDKLEAWATDTSLPSKPICWLNGMAGMGKSTIAYSLCRRFDTKATRAALGASFFCSRQVRDLRRLEKIVPTLAYQLAHHSSSFANALRHADMDSIYAFEKHMDTFLIGPWQQSTKDRYEELPPTLIIIDALDEIDNDDGVMLLRSLLERAEKGGLQGLKILITSRPHPDIVEASKLMSQDAICRLEDIGEQDAQSDIKTFLSDRLPDLLDSHSKEIADLAVRCDKLFIYAATVARFISPPRHRHSKPQQTQLLIKLLRDDKTHGLGRETRLIDDLYTQIISDAITIGPYRHAKLKVLHSIICAFEPLSINDLAELLPDDVDNVDSDAVRILVNDLHAVIYVSNDLIYIYHKSFSDFMLDNQRCGPGFFCKPDVSHCVLTRGCFRAMNQSLRFNICNLPSSYSLDCDVESLSQSLKENIHSIHGLLYACRYWSLHLVGVLGITEGVPSLLDKLLEFCQEKVLFWIEVMNLLAVDHVDCCNRVDAMITWVNNAPGTKSTVLLQTTLTAVSRLARSFLQTPTSASTPHLYISSLSTELSTNPKSPSSWRRRFKGLPQLSCTGISNHSGALLHIPVGSGVNCVAFSPNGKWVVSGSGSQGDSRVKIWDASTGKEVQKYRGSTSPVLSIAFATDGNRVVWGSGGGYIRIWHTSTEQVQTLKGHSDVVNSVAFSTNSMWVVSGSKDCSVRIWDTSTGQEVWRIGGHINSPVKSVAFSTDDMRLLLGSSDRSVYIWDVSSRQKLQTLKGHADRVDSVAFSTDGKRVVSRSNDRRVYIWDTSTGEKVQELSVRYDSSNVHSIAFSTDGKRVVFSGDRLVFVWDTATGNEVQRFEGHTGLVNSVAFSHDGERVVSGSGDGSVRVWDARIGQDVQKLEGHTAWINTVAFSPDGTRVICGSKDCSMRIWDASTGQEVQKLVGHTKWVNSVAFSTDGKRVVSGSDDCSVGIWDAPTGRQVQKLEDHAYRVMSVTFSADGKRVVSGSYDKSVRIWETFTGKKLQKLEGLTDRVESVAFSTDGERVICGLANSSVYIWDISTGQVLQKLEGHTSRWARCTAFSTDRKRVAFSDGIGDCVFIRDTSTGQELQTLRGHTNRVWSVAFSTDGMRVVAGSDDYSVRIWDASTGQQVQKFEGHTKRVESVAFSTDGKWVVSCSHDSIHIWDTSTGHKELRESDWTLDITGWVVSRASQKRLIWLPSQLRESLHGEPSLLVISPNADTVLSFPNASLGTEWANCYNKST